MWLFFKFCNLAGIRTPTKRLYTFAPDRHRFSVKHLFFPRNRKPLATSLFCFQSVSLTRRTAGHSQREQVSNLQPSILETDALPIELSRYMAVQDSNLFPPYSRHKTITLRYPGNNCDQLRN